MDPATILTNHEITAELADLLAIMIEECRANQRGGSVSIVVRAKWDDESDKLTISASTRGSWPCSETETHTVKNPAISLARIGSDEPGQERIA